MAKLQYHALRGWLQGGFSAMAFGVAAAMVLGASPAQDAAPAEDGWRAVFADQYRDENVSTLWVTDGTRTGTQMVHPRVIRDPRDITAIGGGLVMFSAYSDKTFTGEEPWVSDGTRAGTRLVRDIVPSSASGPRDFAPLGDGRVLFRAQDFDNGMELWISDLTRRGTRLLKDIEPGANAWDGRPMHMTQIAPGKVIFSAYTTETGREVWVSDGTRRGTRLVKDMSETNDLRYFDMMTEHNPFTPTGDGRVFVTELHGTGTFITDGTKAGTIVLHERTTSQRDGKPVPISGGGWLFSVSTNHGTTLLVTDGTAEGTREVRPAGGPSYSNTNGAATLPNGRAIFAGYTRELGWELWTSNGRSQGTSLLKDVVPGTNSGVDPAGLSFGTLGDGRLVFSGVFLVDSSLRYQLFVTNGRERGTRLLRTINKTGNARPDNFTSVPDGRVLFQADDGRRGRELWITDGTRRGTSLVRDVRDESTIYNEVPLGLTYIAP